MRNLLIQFLLFLFASFSVNAQSFEYKRGGCIFKDANGKLHKELKFDSYRGFFNGFAIIIKKDKWGIINEKGNIIIEPSYDELWILKGQFRCRMGEKIGLLDTEGKVLIPMDFEWVESMFDGKAVVKDKGEWKWWQDSKLEAYVDDSIEKPDNKVLSRHCLEEVQSCTDRKILEAMFRNIRYPALAREDNIQGKVIIEVIYNEEGFIEKKEIISGIGFGCDEEAYRVIDRINDLDMKGATKDGKKVKSKVVYPITFKLQ